MTAPKPPTPKKVNPYEGMTSDPEFAQAAKELGYSSVNKDHEVAAVREYMLKNKIERERSDKAFRRAESQLYKEGILETNDPFNSKQTWKDHYIKKNNLKGKNAERKATKAYKAEVAEKGKSFIYADDTDTDWELQKIYDRMYDNKAAKSEKQYNKQISQQAKEYADQQAKLQKQSQKAANQQFKKQMAAQKDAQKNANKQYKQQRKDQIAAQEAAAQQQKELMEEMMNQPIYSAQQAALPKVQYKAKAPEPMPAAPAPAPAMNINPAPAPELTNIGNQMSIVRQSSTAKQRSRRRTRGTSSLTN